MEELLDLYTEKEINKLLERYTIDQIIDYSQPHVVSVGSIKEEMDSGNFIFVDSPDGYVAVSDFVDKGNFEEYRFTYDKKIIRTNEGHLFQTHLGWETSKNLYKMYLAGHPIYILHKNGGYKKIDIEKTGNVIPIVDIVVEHKNHRYYTDGLSSHNTNVGKSALMCFLAGELVRMGKNVLYISAEMSEEALYERNDANLLDVTTDQLKDPNLDKEWFLSSLKKLKSRGAGRYVAKEYPTSSAHAGHIKQLLKELRQKKKFKPDIIFLDYINIFTSSRYKTLNGVNSYSYIKAIAEEMRGLAVEENLPIVTATQLNREGSNSSQPDMTNTSECLHPSTTVEERERGNIRIDELQIGDQVKSHDGYKVVRTVHCPKVKTMYKIKTKRGKEILCSGDHVFPSSVGRVSINDNLGVGTKLKTCYN